MTEATYNPTSGLWQPTQLQKLFYGPGSVESHLLSCLPKASSKAFIITGNSLATKTPLVAQVEALLGTHHAGTFSSIGEHAPVAHLDAATTRVAEDPSIDTLISIGGGSPIDSAKALSHRLHEKTGSYLHHIAIPTTLSASECTMLAGITSASGLKTGLRDPNLVPHAVLYDASFAAHTPVRLFTSTGIRALDHAVELLYHPSAAEMPARWTCLRAAEQLFTHLPRYNEDPKDEEIITALQLAAYASLGFLGTNMTAGLGLSHALGYALGSPYGIPHGMTSCLTLGRVVKLKAGEPAAAKQIARLLPLLGDASTGSDKGDAESVGERILGLVKELGLEKGLGEWGVDRAEVGVVAKRATGTEEGDGYKRVEELVGGLF